MPTTTNQHIRAKSDMDLLQRFIAKAEMMNLPNPQAFVQNNLPLLVSQVVEGDDSIADIYAYAAETRDNYIAATPPLPGANLSAVTDDYLEAAISQVQALSGGSSSP